MSRLGSLRSGPLGVLSFRLLAGGQSQREFREFGARTEGEADSAGTPAAKREERAVG